MPYYYKAWLSKCTNLMRWYKRFEIQLLSAPVRQGAHGSELQLGRFSNSCFSRWNLDMFFFSNRNRHDKISV